MTAVALGLVCWLVTAIVVESELFRPLRAWVDRHARPYKPSPIEGFSAAWAAIFRAALFGTTFETKKPVPLRGRLWMKASYLISCHLCAGTWIGLALAAGVPSVRPFGPGLLGWALAGLLVKAVGHGALIVQRAGEAVAR